MLAVGCVHFFALDRRLFWAYIYHKRLIGALVGALVDVCVAQRLDNAITSI